MQRKCGRNPCEREGCRERSRPGSERLRCQLREFIVYCVDTSEPSFLPKIEGVLLVGSRAGSRVVLTAMAGTELDKD